MYFPEPLKQGDKVFLVCTSSPIFAEDIEKCKETVKNLGFNAAPVVQTQTEAFSGFQPAKLKKLS